MAQMLNAQIFITKKHDSDAQLAVPRPNTQT